MLTETVGFLGGMGLFFAGLRITGNGVRQMAGRRFRDRFQRWTRNPLSATGLGFISGILFQSTSGLSMLLANMVSVGAATVSNALPVLVAANAGNASLVLIAIVDVHVLIMITLGFSGLVMAFERPMKLVGVAWASFGVGTMLFGLQTLRVSAAPLAEMPWFQHMLTSSSLSLPLYFVVGAVATLMLQGPAGVIILVITMANSGLIGIENALILIYGSLLGSSILTRFYAIQLKGARQRLGMGQILLNVVGLVIFLPIFIVEHLTHAPLLQALASRLFTSPGAQLTFMSMTFDYVTAVILLFGMPLYLRLLERLYPDDADDGFELLGDVHELSEISADTAILAVNKAQGNLLTRFQNFTTQLRDHLDEGAPLATSGLHDNLVLKLRAIDEGLQDIATSVALDGSQANCVSLAQNSQAMLTSASTVLKDLVDVIDSGKNSPNISALGRTFLESTDFILMLLAESFNSPDPAQRRQLLDLTLDRGPAMERLRSRYLNDLMTASGQDRSLLLRLTSLYERFTWIIHQLVQFQQNLLDALRPEQIPAAD